jgi:calcium-dependent protein kinase
LWSIGVLAYVLLCGYAPFNGANDKEILLRVKGGRYTFPPSEWNGVSGEGKDFIKKLLEYDPTRRMSASEALEHAWIKQLPSDTTKIDPSSQTRILSGLKNFQGISKLKKIALTAIAHQLHDSEISELRRSFAALDANGDGTLTIAELKQGLDKSGIVLPVDFNLLVAEIDSDGSGSIDYMEFIAATMDQKLYNQRDVCWRAFKMFDRDNSGKISVSEFLKILNSPEEDAAKFFDKETIKQMMEEFDANKDGEIDFDEFVNMVTTTAK